MSYMLSAITMEDWEEGIILHLLRMDRLGMTSTIAQSDRSIARIFRETVPISSSIVGKMNE